MGRGTGRAHALVVDGDPDGRALVASHLAEHGFFRPYARYQGGMFPEPWHLSYAPVSLRAIDDLTLDVLRRATEDSAIPGKARVLQLLPEILERHVRNIVPPPPQCA